MQRAILKNSLVRSKIIKDNLGLALIIFCFISFFSWFTMRKFEQGIWCGYDQGVYSQMLWTSLHGRLLWSSFIGINGLCYLGENMACIMLLFLPMYALFPFPATLSIIQVILLGASAIPIYLIAKNKINNMAGLLFAFFFLTNNFTIQAIIEGFQPRTVSVIFFFSCFYFLVKKRYFWLILFLLLLALSHGINCLIVTMFGIYLALNQRKVFLGIVVSILSFGWFIFSIRILQPHLGIAEPLGGLKFFTDGKIFSGPLIIIQYCFSHPLIILKRLFSYRNLDYLLRLFAPLGFLSLLSLKELLIGLPVFLQNLILSTHLIRVEVPRYTMPLVPVLFISMIYSIERHFRKTDLRWKLLKILIIILWFTATYKFVYDRRYNPRFLQILSPVPQEVKIHREALQRIVRLIPAGASICADLKTFPFLANRFVLYDIPFHIEESAYVLIDKKDPTISPKPIISKNEYLKIINKILNSVDYEIIEEDDQIFLLKRK